MCQSQPRWLSPPWWSEMHWSSHLLRFVFLFLVWFCLLLRLFALAVFVIIVSATMCSLTPVCLSVCSWLGRTHRCTFNSQPQRPPSLYTAAAAAAGTAATHIPTTLAMPMSAEGLSLVASHAEQTEALWRGAATHLHHRHAFRLRTTLYRAVRCC